MCFIIREERSVKTLCNLSNDEKKYELKSGLHVRPKKSNLAIRAILNLNFGAKEEGFLGSLKLHSYLAA